ncbi:Toll/interleukin-1 receptor domain-containing protein [Tanacetum coccineum]
MSTSVIEQCHKFHHGTCTYGARCKLVHGIHEARPRPLPNSSTNRTLGSSFVHYGNNNMPSTTGNINKSPTSNTLCLLRLTRVLTITGPTTCPVCGSTTHVPATIQSSKFSNNSTK